jgi:hypothetical protein
MPTKRRKRRPVRKPGGLTPRTFAILMEGHDFSFLDDDPREVIPEAELRELWAAEGAELTALYVRGGWKAPGCANQEPPRPGERPPGFWRFGAPEPRRPDETEADYLRRLGLLLPGE